MCYTSVRSGILWNHMLWFFVTNKHHNMVMDQQPDLLYLLHDYKSLSVSTTHVSKIFQTQIYIQWAYKQNGDIRYNFDRVCQKTNRTGIS